MRLNRLTLVILSLLCGALCAYGQAVKWEPSTGTLPLNQTSELQLVFEGCDPAGDPAVPAVPGLQLQAVGQASNVSIVNGRVSQTVTITFHARATQRMTLTIPPFAVATNKGKIPVAAATYEVGDATVGQGAVALDRVANAQLEAPAEVWAGQVFDLRYSLDVARRYFHSRSNLPEWSPAPLAVEDWPEAQVAETAVSGEQRIRFSYTTRAYAKEPGAVTLNATSQLVNLSTGSPGFGFFSRPNLEQYAIASGRPELRVKALPSPAPASFQGAVGNFKLESKVVPATSAVGEPITWTLTLTGTGNWPDIASLPARDVSRDFRVVQPQARRTLAEGKLFDGSLTEDVVLIPTQPGVYQLGPVSWSYFDAAAGVYRTATTERVTVNVTAPVARTASLPTATPPGGPAASQTPVSSRPVTPPLAPAPIPRDAVDASGHAPLPWSHSTLTGLLCLPLLPLLAAWLALAWRRAKKTDPYRDRRTARDQLREALRRLANTTEVEGRSALVQAWQRETAALWQVPAAVPTAKYFETFLPEAEGRTWAGLWRESETALYGARATLPPEWIHRANTAAEAVRLPRFTPLQLFRARNLLPFAAALVLSVLAVSETRADTGLAAYARGDFPEAERHWRQAVGTRGDDWAAHHNLALALSQQSRWGEAAAHAASAFVQHPRHDSTRWHLTLFSERAGFAPGSLAAFITPSTYHSMARVLSPAEWQRVLVGCAWTAAVALFCFLFAAYQRTARAARFLGWTLLAVALVGAVSGGIGVGAYGNAADARAVILWKPSVLRSIPTEVDTVQKTSPLAAGTIAVADKTFLGWRRLAFENGQTGWVRQEELVPLWK